MINWAPPLEQLVQIAVIREKVADIFLKRRNVVACGIGFKIQGQHQTSVPSLVVSVTRKEPRSQLPESELIPPTVETVLTDVIETGPIVALEINRQREVRPLRPGISIGHRDGTAGTLGCIVRRGEQRFLLSNNHVLALLNTAHLGDPILQPGPGDGGTLDDTIGELAAFEKIRFLDEQEPSEEKSDSTSGRLGGLLEQLWRLFGIKRSPAPPAAPAPVSAKTRLENRIDAALARPYSEVAFDPTILDINGPPTGIADPKLGLRVFKSGRSTGLTSGFITQVDVTIDVDYGSRRARYVNQIMITPISQRGDSGALLVNARRQAVGLVFSGSELVSVASPIRFVLAALRVGLATG